QQFAERSSHLRVIVGDQNPERPRRREAGGAERGFGRTAAPVEWCLGLALRLASGRDQTEPCPLPGGALDLEPATEQRQSFTDAEQAKSGFASLASFGERARVEPDPQIRHGDAERVLLIE